MKKRNTVFFVLTLVFSVVAVVCFAFALNMFVEFIRFSEGESNLGEAIGAAVLAVLGIMASIALWAASVVGGVFAGLNLRAGKKWLRISSACILAADVLMSVTMAVLWIVEQTRGG